MNDNPQPAENNLPALWSWAWDMVTSIAGRFGDPVSLWEMRFIPRDMHARIRAMLRPLEAMLRRLILAEASARPSAEARAKPERQMRNRPAPVLRDGIPARVSFRLFHKSRVAGPWRPKPPACLKPPPPSEISTIPLARRFNAIVRVLNDRERAIRRAVRRLAAGCKGLVLECLKRRPANEPPHIARIMIALQPAVVGAARRYLFNSS